MWLLNNLTKLMRTLHLILTLKWSFDIMDELYAYFKNYEEDVGFLKSERIVKTNQDIQIMKLNRKNLKSLILEVLEESEYYDKHKGMDTDYATQAMELGQSMGDEGARDRTEQVEKYVRLKVDKEIKKDMLKQTRQSIQELVDETRGILGIQSLPGEEDDYDRDQIEGFTKMYIKKLAPAMETRSKL